MAKKFDIITDLPLEPDGILPEAKQFTAQAAESIVRSQNWIRLFSVAAILAGVICLICSLSYLYTLVFVLPTLSELENNGASTESEYFWSSGGLSSFLDNAPTYVVFFDTALSPSGEGTQRLTGQEAELLLADNVGNADSPAITQEEITAARNEALLLVAFYLVEGILLMLLGVTSWLMLRKYQRAARFSDTKALLQGSVYLGRLFLFAALILVTFLLFIGCAIFF